MFGKIVEVREVALSPVLTLVGDKFCNSEGANYQQSGLEPFFSLSSCVKRNKTDGARQ